MSLVVSLWRSDNVSFDAHVYMTEWVFFKGNLDFNVCRFEEVISFFWRSVYMTEWV